MRCVYCNTENETGSSRCRHCGMPLPREELRDRKRLRRPFLWLFWLVVIFCAVMIFLLPRSLG
ncbi:hypothetical protein [Microbulbifer marinus]|uniref:DnrP protein n=1 Tax=Microbulbifer marinus TaxID=658218 RepID=A0A1H4B0L7_9GAMM|nr:hypothetical protein [Microbulbifer marinus]SEA41690.1 hypothetical protein SAMN05216562_3017 [Microbulbifer marinus]